MSLPWPPVRTSDAPDAASQGLGLAGDAFDMQGKPWPVPDFPASLQHDVRRSLDASRQLRPQAGQLAFGQIRGLATSGPEAPTLGLLLLLQIDGGATQGRWEGLLVSPDVDYAATTDLVIQAEDGVTTSVCGVVFSEPRVCCRLDLAAPLLGRLHAETIGRLPLASTSVMPAGIGLGVREVSPDVFAVTGTRDPLDPPRLQYMRLVAAAVQPLVDVAPVQAPAPVPRKAGLQWLWGGLAGAALAMVVAVLIPQPPVDMTRGASPAGSAGLSAVQMRTVPALSISPAPDATVANLNAALQDINAMVVGGPGEDGRYVIALLSMAPAEAIDRLRASGVVESVTELRSGARVAP